MNGSIKRPQGRPVIDQPHRGERLFNQVVEGAPNAIVMTDRSGTIVMVNEQAEHIFGYPRAEMIGESIEMLLPDRVRAHHRALRASYLKAPESRSMGIGRDLYGLRKNGLEFPVEVGLNPIETEEGSMILASILDITARKTIERSLRDSEHRLRSLASIVESSEDAIISNDLEGIVVSWNKAAERIFGYASAEMVGRSILRLAIPGHSDEMLGILDRIRTGQKIDHYETLRRHKNGTILHVSLSVSPLYDVAGELVGASKVAHDITAAVEAKSALQASQARLRELHSELLHVSRLSAMGEMASALAHELNQPLAAMSNYMAGSRRLLASSQDPNAPKIQLALDKAAEQAIRAGQIIRRLRDFVARGESERHVESISKMVEDASALGLAGARERGVLFRTDLDPQSDLVLVDRIQIQQVLLNLFRNAIEAMEDQPTHILSVRSFRVGSDLVAIAVEDTGPGLSDEALSNLFQPFFTTKKSGMGVGLSISRSIVEAHGGSMRAERNDKGGATFLLTLTRAADAEGPHAG